MVKIPQWTLWAKITWQIKKKRKEKKMNTKITISKDNKKGNSLIAFIGDLEHSNPLLGTFQSLIKFKNKNKRIIKV